MHSNDGQVGSDSEEAGMKKVVFMGVGCTSLLAGGLLGAALFLLVGNALLGSKARELIEEELAQQDDVDVGEVRVNPMWGTVKLIDVTVDSELVVDQVIASVPLFDLPKYALNLEEPHFYGGTVTLIDGTLMERGETTRFDEVVIELDTDIDIDEFESSGPQVFDDDQAMFDLLVKSSGSLEVSGLVVSTGDMNMEFEKAGMGFSANSGWMNMTEGSARSDEWVLRCDEISFEMSSDEGLQGMKETIERGDEAALMDMLAEFESDFVVSELFVSVPREFEFVLESGWGTSGQNWRGASNQESGMEGLVFKTLGRDAMMVSVNQLTFSAGGSYQKGFVDLQEAMSLGSDRQLVDALNGMNMDWEYQVQGVAVQSETTQGQLAALGVAGSQFEMEESSLGFGLSEGSQWMEFKVESNVGSIQMEYRGEFPSRSSGLDEHVSECSVSLEDLPDSARMTLLSLDIPNLDRTKSGYKYEYSGSTDELAGLLDGIM